MGADARGARGPTLLSAADWTTKERIMIIAATGHRPQRLGVYDKDTMMRLRRGAAHYIGKKQPTKGVSGMALGWDTAWALALIDQGIPLIAAVPFEGQESRWPKEDQERHRFIVRQAAAVVVVCPGGYAAWKLQKRNEWMVDHADEMVALWDGSRSGTGNCVAYANASGKPVVNLWPSWERSRNAPSEAPVDRSAACRR